MDAHADQDRLALGTSGPGLGHFVGAMMKDGVTGQAELVAEVQDCLAHNSPTGEIAEESTTRKKIAPIWRALRKRE